MSDPAHAIDTSSELRGITHKLNKTHTLRNWRAETHATPQVVSSPWLPTTTGRPRSTKNPALEQEWVLNPVRPGVLPDSIIDARSPQHIIGVSSRQGNRIVCRK